MAPRQRRDNRRGRGSSRACATPGPRSWLREGSAPSLTPRGAFRSRARPATVGGPADPRVSSPRPGRPGGSDEGSPLYRGWGSPAGIGGRPRLSRSCATRAVGNIPSNFPPTGPGERQCPLAPLPPSRPLPDAWARSVPRLAPRPCDRSVDSPRNPPAPPRPRRTPAPVSRKRRVNGHVRLLRLPRVRRRPRPRRRLGRVQG